MGRIAVLPPAVQGQIAAGEVIERPASVVKELVENALDAGARQVEVRLVGGGLDLITVRDDGEGLDADDACLAFARHATSKLARADDLAAVGTFGFRGEALPSIAAVARTRLVTRRVADGAAVVVEADADGVRTTGVAGAAPGTCVEVRGLFAAMPARRKFMRAPATEVGHVVDVLHRLGAARPGVSLRVVHGDREVLALPAVRDRRQRLAQILGTKRVAAMAPVEATADGFSLSGFLAPPAESLSSARLVWTYVGLGSADGGRWVRDKLLLRAVLDGYESLLMRGRYPIAVLFLTAPPGEVDVNVHPAKLEVRFHRPTVVHQLVVRTLRSRLASALAPGEGAATIVREGTPTYGPAPPPALPAGSAPASTTAGLWAAAPGGYRSLRFVGQVFEGYLVCEGDGRMVLIDQHAAHERVVFERLRAERAATQVERDPLLVPEAIELPPVQAAALAEHTDVLAAAGLEGEPFGEGTFLLRTVPRLLRGRDVGALLRALAAELVENGASAAGDRTADAALATIACHSVVRVGQSMDPAQVRALLEAMDEVEVAAHCPHGRPVATELSRSQVERLFGR